MRRSILRPPGASGSLRGMKQEPIRPTDEQARDLARRLLSQMRHAVMGTLDPATGTPLVTRISVQIDDDGIPVALLSGLSAHSRALQADLRVGLLVSDDEAVKGDPMAHARLSILARAELAPLDEHRREQWLARAPKARAYIDLPDFRYWRLVPQSALLNGGFGQAFHLTPDDMRQTPAA